MPRNGYYMPKPTSIFYTFNPENAQNSDWFSPSSTTSPCFKSFFEVKLLFLTKRRHYGEVRAGETLGAVTRDTPGLRPN